MECNPFDLNTQVGVTSYFLWNDLDTYHATLEHKIIRYVHTIGSKLTCQKWHLGNSGEMMTFCWGGELRSYVTPFQASRWVTTFRRNMEPLSSVFFWDRRFLWNRGLHLPDFTASHLINLWLFTLSGADTARSALNVADGTGWVVWSVLLNDATSYWVYSISDRWMKCEYRLLAVGYFSVTTEVLGDSFITVPLCPLQIRHELSWNCGILLELWWIPWGAYYTASIKE